MQISWEALGVVIALLTLLVQVVVSWPAIMRRLSPLSPHITKLYAFRNILLVSCGIIVYLLMDSYVNQAAFLRDVDPNNPNFDPALRSKLIEREDAYQKSALIYPFAACLISVVWLGIEIRRRGMNVRTRDYWVVATSITIGVPLILWALLGLDAEVAEWTWGFHIRFMNLIQNELGRTLFGVAFALASIGDFARRAWISGIVFIFIAASFFLIGR